MACQQYRLRLALPRCAKAFRDERRHAACRNADDDIAPTDAALHRAPRIMTAVLRSLARAKDRPASSRHDGLHQRRLRVKRRRTFRGLNNTQPAARARAEEEEPPAASQALRDEPDGPRDLRMLAPHRSDDAGILAAHQPEQVWRGKTVEVTAGRMRLFCREAIVADAGHTFCQDSMSPSLMLH